MANQSLVCGFLSHGCLEIPGKLGNRLNRQWGYAVTQMAPCVVGVTEVQTITSYVKKTYNVIETQLEQQERRAT